MTLLDHVQSKVPMRKVGAGEWHGPCPGCGTSQKNPAFSDRFSVREGVGGEADHWFCRNCGHGDLIDFLRKFCGYSFADACKEAGKELPEQQEHRTPKFCPPVQTANTFEPRDIQAPADKWREHAEKFAQACHQHLLDAGTAEGTPLHYLAERGITRETAIAFRLGWNPGEKGKDSYRVRDAWGLETVLKDDGKPKKLWLPIGLVIPFYQNDQLRRLRIRIPKDRRSDNSLPYYLVPGSSMDTFVAGPGAKAYVITEAELDAILVHQEAGDLAGAMAMGNSTAKPTAEAHQLLVNSLHISNALDYDAGTDANGRYTNPGGKAALWWKETYPQADRWPVPVGKDPGDLIKAGISVREWVKAGLPPALTLPKAQPVSRPVPQPAPPTAAAQDHDNSGAVCSAAAAEQGGQPVKVLVVKAGSHELHITDDKQTWQQLGKQGNTAYSINELQRLIDTVDLAGEHADHAKELLMCIKDEFRDGGYIKKVVKLEE